MAKAFKGKHYLFILIDFLLAFVLVFISFLAFYGVPSIKPFIFPVLFVSLGLSAIIVASFYAFGVYKVLTHSFGLAECVKTIFLAFVIMLLYLLVAYLFLREILNIGDINYLWIWFFLMLVICFSLPSLRLFWRLLSMIKYSKNHKNIIRTLIVGAGDAAKIVIDDSKNNPSSNNKIVVLVDDDHEKIKKTFSGLPICGPISDIASIICKYKVEEVIIAIANLSQDKLREMLELLEPCPVRVRRMPLLSEMASPNVQNIVNVDLNELLCRKPIKLDNHELNEMLHGKTVLVTGAGGSIGSELVQQIFDTHPKTLVLFDIYENSTYDIQQKIRTKIRKQNIKDVELVTLIGSTYNEVRVEQIMKKYHPDYIYHAAAYKHVPLMEDSPAEAIRTNVIGTYNVARLADKYKVKKMVLVSTDKAVRPTNVMGATKRFAETIIQYFADKSKNTSYAAVRFGNVLGSNGSVVPLFMKQIAAGGPVTITDKNIIRYFMTIPEAVSLILQCSLFATGGEIFILDMGKPVKILSLAEKLIRQAGYVPYKDIDIVETGLRPGEKLYEELLIDKEHQIKTPNELIYIEEKEKVYPVEDEIKTISQVFDMDETGDVKELLSKVISTYKITDNN